MKEFNREITGESLIEAICNKLENHGKHCTDSNIVQELRNINIKVEGNPAVQVSGLYEWVNPINKV